MNGRVNVYPYIGENIEFPLLLCFYWYLYFVLLFSYAQWYFLIFLESERFQIRALGIDLNLQKRYLSLLYFRSFLQCIKLKFQSGLLFIVKMLIINLQYFFSHLFVEFLQIRRSIIVYIDFEGCFDLWSRCGWSLLGQSNKHCILYSLKKLIHK